MFSVTFAEIDSYCSVIAILSISSIIFSTEFKEYGSFFKLSKVSFKFSKFEISKSTGRSKFKSPK